MNEDNQNQFSKELKPLASAFKESLPEMKNMVLAPIAFGMAFVEKYLREASEKRLIVQKEEEIRFQNQLREKKEMEIAAEIRSEERQLRLYKEQNKLTPRRIIHTGLASLSTIALLFGVVQLVPIARRSRNINQCISELSRSNQKLKSSERTILCTRGYKLGKN